MKKGKEFFVRFSLFLAVLSTVTAKNSPNRTCVNDMRVACGTGHSVCVRNKNPCIYYAEKHYVYQHNKFRKIVLGPEAVKKINELLSNVSD